MWILTYDAPKHSRMNRYFHGVTNFDGWWWHDELKDWFKLGDPKLRGGGYGSHAYGPKTTKAFKRFLNKYCDKLKGTEVVFANFYIGCDIKANWIESTPQDTETDDE